MHSLTASAYSILLSQPTRQSHVFQVKRELRQNHMEYKENLRAHLGDFQRAEHILRYRYEQENVRIQSQYRSPLGNIFHRII